MIVDLEKIAPQGRVDVLAYRGAQMLTQKLESQYGLSGIWEAIKPHVNQAIAKGFDGVELPTEAKILLQIVQTNWNKEQRGIE